MKQVQNWVLFLEDFYNNLTISLDQKLRLSRTHRLKVLDSFRIKDFFYAFPVSGTPWQQL